ncbi:hypothetical protein Aph01nite_13130 [Acrocarpospora phusangensis]|uniref:Uncharacterized protein n=1 Tax=Acrocarpospora phusangensis TaxID=1070424 RepID=A0A919Q6T9_9ACTN|nr:hypothetical protein [Acrocarpospora phusangensis]GIH23003.1 hypothetical protein Aph01nite_13130 [Acrocarpospora phusangensis]
MPKGPGFGDRLFVSGYDFANDIGSISRIGGGPAPLIVTGIDKEGQERIGGKIDGEIALQAFFNPDEGRAHPVFSALPTGDQVLSYCRGTTLGNPGAGLVAKQIDYPGNRAADGMFTFDVSSLAAAGFGVEWGRQGTPGARTDTEATDGDSIDDGAATEFGLSAYLHVFDLDGDDVTIGIEESSDDGGADSWAAVVGGEFAEVTASHSYERISTAADLTVERYLRVVSSGTFTSVSFAVLIVRHLTAPEF